MTWGCNVSHHASDYGPGSCHARRLYALASAAVDHHRSWRCPLFHGRLLRACSHWHAAPGAVGSSAPVASPPKQSRPALQLAAEVERMGAVDGGVSISLDAVYSMFNTACAKPCSSLRRLTPRCQVCARKHHGADAGAVDGAGCGHAGHVLVVWRWYCGLQVAPQNVICGGGKQRSLMLLPSVFRC